MEDPDPSNIYGEKRSVHTVDHIIRWDYALLAALGLYVAYKFFSRLSARSDEESDSGPLTGQMDDAADAAEVMLQ